MENYNETKQQSIEGTKANENILENLMKLTSMIGSINYSQNLISLDVVYKKLYSADNAFLRTLFTCVSVCVIRNMTVHCSLVH